MEEEVVLIKDEIALSADLEGGSGHDPKQFTNEVEKQRLFTHRRHSFRYQCQMVRDAWERSPRAATSSLSECHGHPSGRKGLIPIDDRLPSC